MLKIFLLLWPIWMVSCQLEKFVPGNQIFSANIYQQLSKIETGNFMVSPLSLEIVLALVAAGARGQTGDEIRGTLYLPTRQTEVNSIFSEVIQTLRSTGKYSLTTANRLFIRSDFQVHNSYRNLGSRFYNAGAENLDFNKAQQTANSINKWVEQQTNNKIENLISEKQITPDLVLVLVNTLYLHANWSQQFDSVPTQQLFYGDKGRTVSVPMMTRTSFYNYYDSQELDCQMLEIPYIDNDISMIIALPKQRNGLVNLENHITDLLAHNKFSQERVSVTLPKFTTETNIEFVPILQNLGIRTIFTDASNLSGISQKPLKVSDVVQKTFINVTESGTEAAAATAGLALTLAIHIPEPPPEIFFIADHPFLYSIVRKSVRTILFTGRVVKL